ncbi:MAG TPA: DUF3443 domain-containing protein [Spongiibacteraceae bacterium]
MQPISVNGGPSAIPNLTFTSISVCTANTSQCQTIDNVLIDTGSVGLRVLSSALGGLSLQQQPGAPGPSFAECVPFVDGSYAWGPVRIADVKIAGQIASSVPIQIVADPSFGTAPVPCFDNSSPNTTPRAINSVEALGGNAILGIGNFREDCGLNCSTLVQNDYYYGCGINGCAEIAVDPMYQVKNPIALFPVDNNGVIIQLPSVSSGGAASINGWMIFGINTRDNNALGNATIYTVGDSLSTSPGNITTNYKGIDYKQSFFDSGSNGLFFPDNSIPICDNAGVFFCPSSPLSLSAKIIGQNNASLTISFSIANAKSLNASFNAFSNLGGKYNGGFDWGMSFFFGRKIFTAIAGQPGISAPYVAF